MRLTASYWLTERASGASSHRLTNGVPKSISQRIDSGWVRRDCGASWHWCVRGGADCGADAGCGGFAGYAWEEVDAEGWVVSVGEDVREEWGPGKVLQRGAGSLGRDSGGDGGLGRDRQGGEGDS